MLVRRERLKVLARRSTLIFFYSEAPPLPPFYGDNRERQERSEGNHCTTNGRGALASPCRISRQLRPRVFNLAALLLYWRISHRINSRVTRTCYQHHLFPDDIFVQSRPCSHLFSENIARMCRRHFLCLDTRLGGPKWHQLQGRSAIGATSSATRCSPIPVPHGSKPTPFTE